MPFSSSTEAQAAVLKSWAFTEDRTARIQPSHDAFRANFEKRVDPKDKLEPHVRAARAELLYQAHFKAMAAKSVKARQRKAKERRAAADAMRAAREQEILD